MTTNTLNHIANLAADNAEAQSALMSLQDFGVISGFNPKDANSTVMVTADGAQIARQLIKQGGQR